MSHAISLADLITAQELAYKPSGLEINGYVKEEESQEYSACMFVIKQRCIKFRTGKITPTKIGQFVTLWKRSTSGMTVPHDISDPVDLFVVSVRNSEHLGQFVFPKAVLCEKGIISKDGIGGKRGIRVYPPWDIATNRQAKQTQAWQLLYFFEIDPKIPVDVRRVQELYLGGNFLATSDGMNNADAITR